MGNQEQNPKMVNDDNWWVDFVTAFMVNNIPLLLALGAYDLLTTDHIRCHT